MGKPIHAIVDELLMLFSESAEYHSQPTVRCALQDAVRSLCAIRHRLEIAQRRYVVAVVGLSNVGKSTLLNALLGSELAPRRNGPCTAAPIEFQHGERLLVIVSYRDSSHRDRHYCTSSDQVQERLTILADDATGAASRRILKVVVEVPVALLEQYLVIADTPGFGAAQRDDSAGSHEEALRRYLTTDVSQVFWVVLADQGIGRRELQFHDKFFAEVCDDILVTGSEDWDDSDRQRFRRRFNQMFAGRMPRFHFVSGLEGLRAREQGDVEALEKAGIVQLEARIRELADPALRLARAEGDVEALATDISEWLSEFRDERGDSLRRRWRSDSWSRWMSLQAEASPLKARLSQLLLRRQS